jgi:tetratricopeptide (TPR) repeat protein
MTKIYVWTLALSLVLFANQSATAQLFGTPDWAKLTVDIPVKKQFDIKQFKKIAIGDINDRSGTRGVKGTDVMEEFTVKLQSMGGIEILDRQYLQNILEEHKLSSSGLVDESTAKQLGKFIGSGVLLLGRVQTDTYGSTVYNLGTTLFSTNNCNSYQREGTYKLAVNIKLLDVEKATVIFAKTIPAEYTARGGKYECNANVPELNQDELYAECLKVLGQELVNTFTDHKQSVRFEFETDSKFNDQLKKAITNFNIGDVEGAYEIMKGIAERVDLKDKVKARAHYNLGLVQMHTNELSEAVKNLQLAYQLQPSNEAYLQQFNIAKKTAKGE